MSLQSEPQNENKTFQKLYFDFSHCKLPELAGCFTPFKESFRDSAPGLNLFSVVKFADQIFKRL